MAVIGGIVLLAVGGDDGSDSDQPSTAQVKSLQDQVLKRTVVNQAAGISVRRPADWRDTQEKGLIALRSHDSCVAITLAAPPGKTNPQALLSNSLTVLKRSYTNAQAQKVPGGEVGGIPTTTYTIFGRNGKTPVRILLSVGDGESHAYLTEVMVRDPACQGALQRAQIVLSSVQYTK